ncbi:glycosyltransferase family 2 protein [Marinobacteraceae bacterium S3BR75-40.1]
MIEWIFWLSLFGAVYSYFLYPLLLSVVPVRRKPEQPKGETAFPRISLIVTAHNEESRIETKLKNCLELQYPDLEIIVASDASTDATDEIVKAYSHDNVVLARAEERKGKEYAQWQAIQRASGEILVFSDVATEIPNEALKRLSHYFQNNDVGAVSSEDRFVSRDGQVAGEGAYVKYEMWLRKLESHRSGLVGLSGSFFAARKSVCLDWDIESPSDFNTALNCAKSGMVAVTAPDVLGYYSDVSDPQKEYNRKVRTVIRGMTALERHPEVLNPARFGWFSFQVISHKLMRWAVPWCLMVLFMASLLLNYKGGIYSLATWCQYLFYGVVIAGHFKQSLLSRTFVKIPYFFVQVNIAIAKASIEFAQGKRMTVWTPSQR